MSLTDNIYTLARIFFPSVNTKCTHSKISPSVDQAYCPDCGKLIKNEWYITRCNCCGIKIKAMVKNGEVIPQYNYCSNCGSNEYIVEKIDKINFINIKFAALVKKEVEEESFCNTTKCWEEKSTEQPKLLTQFL